MIIKVRVAGVLWEDNRLLLVRHARGDLTYWLLPGGGVEYGESLAGALEREIREETGLEVAVGPLLWVCDTLPPDRHRHIVHHMFAVRRTGGTFAVIPQDRLVEARFIPKEELPSLTIYPPIGALLVEGLPPPLPSSYLGPLWDTPFLLSK